MENRKVKIGNVEICGWAALAPMAGVTDSAYRTLCMQMGAAYCVTEMVSAKAMMYSDKKTAGIAFLDEKARPSAIQIFGDEPETVAESAKKLMEYRPNMIDINMGCPVPKIAGNNSGSALMKNPPLCGEIVQAVSEAVDVPVTVKIRKGWDEEQVNAVEVAKICQQAGAAAVAVHGRTKMQMYSGKADWDIIRQVKEALTVPVIGNGDVTDPTAAMQMLEETGCDLVMIGRAAQGNPWVFRDINAALNHGIPLPPPSLLERIVMIKRHIEAACADKGEDRGMREARKHVAWYLHGMRSAAEFRRRAGFLSTMKDLDMLMKDVYEANIEIQESEKI
jgi:putative TIM-barrel protein, nifR3 family